jgi:hypothetical protein
LDDLKERTGYCHLKEEALNHTMWRACFGRDFGPVIRHTKWKMYCKWFSGFFLASNLSHGARHACELSAQTSKDEIRKHKPILFLLICVLQMELGSLCLLLVNFHSKKSNKIYINPTTFLKFEVFMVVSIKLWVSWIWNHALWYIHKYQYFGGTCSFYLQ